MAKTTTISLSPEAKETIRELRELGLGINVSALCSRAIVREGKRIRGHVVAPVEEVLAFLVERIDDLEIQAESLRRVITLLHPQEDVDRAVRQSSEQMAREALQQQENETNKKQT